MDSQVFDYVKYEKAKAIASFNRFRNLTRMLQFVEVLVALMLISWSSTRVPAVFKLSGTYLSQICLHLCSPHIVFILGNVIIISIVVLCRKEDSGVDSSSTSDHFDGIACGCVQDSDAHARIASSASNGVPDDPSPSPMETLQCESFDSEEVKQADVCSEVAVSETQCDAVTTAIEMATKQIKRFERTQSEKLKQEITVKPDPILRRSETEVRRRTPNFTPLEAVDNLSSEEFQLTIEAFIKRHQDFFKEQKLAETAELKRSHVVNERGLILYNEHYES